jgi:hypothetical protein
MPRVKTIRCWSSATTISGYAVVVMTRACQLANGSFRSPHRLETFMLTNTPATRSRAALATNATHEQKRPTISGREALPPLLIDEGNLPATARKLCERLRGVEYLFERGGPVKITANAITEMPTITSLRSSDIVIEAHKVCRPLASAANRTTKEVTLPHRVAKFYLRLDDDRDLRPLKGIVSSPLLEPDGAIRAVSGYDADRMMWCAKIPSPSIPAHPTKADAQAALGVLRNTFRTFPFADAVRKRDAVQGLELIDLDQPPGLDESTLLAGLMTAICRASLDHAPGLLVTAPLISGSGTGKGLLVRAICEIGFGYSPLPFTAGENRNELDKRLSAALLTGSPALFLDNFNGQALKSDLLAQLLTEGPVIISRKLGATAMLEFSPYAFVVVTGNGVAIAEDQVRRFVVTELNARCEHPEQRQFESDFLGGIRARRAELLTSALTIWRWGRQNEALLTRGRALGSFEQWALWCRDPLLSLGGRDPVERIEAVKRRDPDRQRIAELFQIWSECHDTKPVAATDLDKAVLSFIDPQGRGRQFQSSALQKLVNTEVGGFVLTEQKPVGHWGRITYALKCTAAN